MHASKHKVPFYCCQCTWWSVISIFNLNSNLRAHFPAYNMAAVNREQGDNSDGLQALGAASFTYSREALPTWRTLSVDHPCTHMKLVDFSKMELIRSFLSRNLPSSCKTFGLVQTLLQDKCLVNDCADFRQLRVNY